MSTILDLLTTVSLVVIVVFLLLTVREMVKIRRYAEEMRENSRIVEEALEEFERLKGLK